MEIIRVQLLVDELNDLFIFNPPLKTSYKFSYGEQTHERNKNKKKLNGITFHHKHNKNLLKIFEILNLKFLILNHLQNNKCKYVKQI